MAIVHCSGKLTGADLCASVVAAFETRRMEPSLDRIVTVDRRARLYEIDFGVLQNIQRLVLEEETRGDREASFRTVLVYSSPMQKHIMQLYKTIWDGLNLPQVDFFISPSQEEALELLGSRPVGARRGEG